jgi:hypothetical protein
MTPPITIPNVTPAQIAALLAELKADHDAITTVTPNEYGVEGHGVGVTASYAPDTSVLTVQIVHKPWLIPEGMIHDQIVKALGQADTEGEAKPA